MKFIITFKTKFKDFLKHLDNVLEDYNLFQREKKTFGSLEDAFQPSNSPNQVIYLHGDLHMCRW